MTIERSVDKLTEAVGQRLKKVSKTITTEELSEIHSFLKEAKGLQDTLLSMGTFEDPRYSEEIECQFEEASGEPTYDIFLQACYLILDMYRLLDDNKIKETGSEWILEDTKYFMDLAREVYGPKVPELPLIRILSKPKSPEINRLQVMCHLS